MLLSDKDKIRTTAHIYWLKAKHQNSGSFQCRAKAYGRHIGGSLSGNAAEFWLEQEAIIGVMISHTVCNCNQCRCLHLSGRQSTDGENVQLMIFNVGSFSTWLILKGLFDTQNYWKARNSEVWKKSTMYDD